MTKPGEITLLQLPENISLGSDPVTRLTDTFLKAVENRLAAFPPERGGAILGFGGTGHLLVEDNYGAYSASSWDISPNLSSAVSTLEKSGYGQLLGTVHTHPSGVLDPSGQDVATTTKALHLNPHLDDLLICVVTAGKPRNTDIPIGANHRMSVHILSRGRDGKTILQRARSTVTPLGHDLREAGIKISSHVNVDEGSDPNLNGHQIPPVIVTDGRPSLAIPTSHGNSAVLVDALYPLVPPVLIKITKDGISARPSPWDATKPAGQQLRTLINLTQANDTTSTLDGDERVARVKELTGPLNNARVLVAGAGSVGSRITEDLVRSGIKHVSIIDPDIVSLPNLSRSTYFTSQVGEPKVTALSRNINKINPSCSTTAVQSSILNADIDTLLVDIDLVILATDDMSEQAHLAYLSYAQGVPQVACAMYRKGAAGEVVLVVPSASTPCWSCSIGTRSVASNQRPDINYGVDGRLVAESALGPSINAVASIASQAAIGVLAGPSTPAGDSITRLIGECRTLGLVSTTPNWALFCDLFEGMAHQHQPQSAWPQVIRAADCPICGEHRIPPSKSSQATKDASLEKIKNNDEYDSTWRNALKDGKAPTELFHSSLRASEDVP